MLKKYIKEQPHDTGTITHFALLSGNDDILIAVTALFRRAVNSATGVDHVAHQVPVRSVCWRHDGQVQRKLQ